MHVLIRFTCVSGSPRICGRKGEALRLAEVVGSGEDPAVGTPLDGLQGAGCASEVRMGAGPFSVEQTNVRSFVLPSMR